jgi:hypothetical protein
MAHFHGLHEMTFEQAEILTSLIGTAARHQGKESGMRVASLVIRMASAGKDTTVDPTTCRFIDAVIAATPEEYVLLNPRPRKTRPLAAAPDPVTK